MSWWRRQPPRQYCYQIYGYNGCGYFNQAIHLGETVQSLHPNVRVSVQSVPRPQWPQLLQQTKDECNQPDLAHKTSPAIWEGCGDTRDFVGGYTQFKEKITELHPIT